MHACKTGLTKLLQCGLLLTGQAKLPESTVNRIITTCT